MPIKITETFYPKTKDKWREWLLKNHNLKKEIWVIKFKKRTGKPTISYQDSVDGALCFGWIDGIEKSIDSEKYAQRFTPRKEKSHWTQTNINRYKMLLKQDLITEAGKIAFENLRMD